jgi:hypothetical protein
LLELITVLSALLPPPSLSLSLSLCSSFFLTGYYTLDLSKPSHRKCLNKLSSFSASQAALRKEQSKLGYARTGDVSQHGNYSLFRNEQLNGKPVILSAAFCSPIPVVGKLEFDFSCHLRPAMDDIPITDERLIRLLVRYYLLEPKDIGVAFQKLFDAKVKAGMSIGCNGMNFTGRFNSSLSLSLSLSLCPQVTHWSDLKLSLNIWMTSILI